MPIVSAEDANKFELSSPIVETKLMIVNKWIFEHELSLNI